MKVKAGVVFGAVLAVFVGGGCMQSTKEILVKKDGSGTITETSYLGEAAMAMMAQMGAQAGAAGPKLLDVEKFKREAGKLGEGVAYVSAEEIAGEKGEKGVKVVYSFEDISKLKIQPGEAPSDPAKAKNAFGFKFDKGTPTKLTITVPSGFGMNDKEQEQTEEQIRQSLAMMKQMMKGLKMWVRLRVDGTITETNATHVNKEKTGLTLVRMDFDKMIEDEDKFIKMSLTKDEAKAREAAKNMPGLTMETQKEITISFE